MTLAPSPSRRRRWAVLFGALALVLLGASPAAAHSELERSDPANGGMVSVGRTELTLYFTQTIDSGASTFNLHTLDGVETTVEVSTSEADGGEVVTITTPPLQRATYVMDWRVLSLEDGHASRGSVLFGVGVRPVVVPASGVSLPETRALVLRWLDLLAILLAIGAVAVSGRVLGAMGESGKAPRRRARVIAAISASAAVVTGVLMAFESTRSSDVSTAAWIDTTWTTLTSTPWGYLWLAREIALAIAAVALAVWAIRRRPPGLVVKVGFVALMAAVWLEGWAGHAAALPSRTLPAIFVAAVHIVAAGVWAGGLIALALCLMSLGRRDPQRRGPILTSAWRAFSPMAALAAVVLLASGLIETGLHVTGLHSIFSTLWGGVLMAKVALLALALGFAGINTLLVNPAIAGWFGRVLRRRSGWVPVPPRRFRFVLGLEALVLIGAVAAAGLLTSVPTAREVDTAEKPSAPYVSNVDGLFVTFEELPSGPDESRLIVKASQVTLPAPGAINGADVRLVGPDGKATAVPLKRFEIGRYEGVTTKPEPGAWQATVSVHRAGAADAVMPVSWTVDPPQGDVIRPMELITTGLALVLLSGTAAVVVIVRRRRQSAPPSIPQVREKADSYS